MTTHAQNQETILSLTKKLEELGANFSPQMHYVASHLQLLKERQTMVSDQHGERVHQSMKLFEERYMGKDSVRMLAEFVWNI